MYNNVILVYQACYTMTQENKLLNEINEMITLERISSEVKLFPMMSYLSAITTLSLKLNKNISTVTLDLDRNFSVKKVEMQSEGLIREIGFIQELDLIKISSLDQSKFSAGDLDLRIHYTSTNPENTSTFVVSPEGSYGSWINSWYPRIIEQRTLGSFNFEIDKDHSIVCTGELESKIGISDTHNRWTYVSKQKTDFGFASAKYNSIETIIDELPVSVHFLKDKPETMQNYVSDVSRILNFYKNELFGMYPYPNYRLVEIPSKHYHFGGSSEQSMNYFPELSLPDHHFNFAFFTHELGHSYWGSYAIGNCVVLSEGLAQMTSLLAFEHIYGEELMRQYAWNGCFDSFQALSIYASMIVGANSRYLIFSKIQGASPSIRS